MRRLGLWLSAAALLTLLTACGGAASSGPSIKARAQDIELKVPARGEIVASESLPIALPGSVRMGFNIAWIAPEFSDIRKGEVIARFDDVQIQLDRESSALAVAKSEFKLADSERTGEVELARIGHEALRVDGERDISETFATVDERLLSRNEIIDALSDLEYLEVQAAFLDWQADTFDQRTEAEQNLIRAERQGELSKLEKQDMALNMMELRSPADGTLVYARTPWGEKIGKGKRVFPGMPIGLLPIRGKVKARLFVPENDAVGLLSGQAVRVQLDAAAEREFTAVVESVSPVASPRNRSNPQKFFSVEAVIDEVDAELMRVGSQLRAEIITGSVSDGIVVPAQAVYGAQGSAHVYVLTGGGTERREVTLGRRSPDLVEILAGLESGDRLSLVAPPDAG
ncbi:MAG: HlyD family efflux transporter periplasmic adaptor subunit [Pseudomonadota bacterium]